MKNNNIENIKLVKIDPKAYIASDYVKENSGKSFSEILTRYILEFQKNYKANQREISDAAGMQSALISKYKYGYRKPTLNAVILLSLAMRLTPERSEYLLYAAGYVLNDQKEHRIYKLFLEGCAFNEEYSIENCNKFLLKNGYPMLSI